MEAGVSISEGNEVSVFENGHFLGKYLGEAVILAVYSVPSHRNLDVLSIRDRELESCGHATLPPNSLLEVFFFASTFGLSYDTNEPVLKGAFEQQHGEILEVKVICDHKSGKSKGYGFVQFTSETAATTALKEMDGQLLDGRNIRVQFAHKG
ncbi:Splicing factor-like protein [Parasponia andersonii]|uniref:Splicing factor-like protein n=1 Tax=Parasponia andersonii TaxID=3476 RepID=A0A2P5CD45_PARAD|nr:Splicing factor-like protein [Parasponia andersonii]